MDTSDKPDETKDFFVSYNSADKGWAEWIAAELERAGYTTVIQAWDFRPGTNFVLQMQQALQQTNRTIAVLSPQYISAAYTQPEWAEAFGRDPTGEKGLLLPVRVVAFDPPGLLSTTVYIDLVERDESDAREELLRGVTPGRLKPTSQFSFPGTSGTSSRLARRFPGALPPVWRVPFFRNPHFTGRDDLLSTLRDRLLSDGPPTRIQALFGLGGAGKTQLALEHAYREAAEYEFVAWLPSAEPAELEAAFVGLAEPLGIAVAVGNFPETARAVREEIERRSRWLLVFDNAPDYQSIEPYLPRAGAGHIVITSRDANWSRFGGTVRVGPFDRQESNLFIQRRTLERDGTETNTLADQLGDLPLALDHAVAYIERTGASVRQYTKLFRDRRAELLRYRDPSAPYPETVGTTWDIAFRQLHEDSPASAALLQQCAFLAAEDIPIDLLRAGTDNLHESLRAIADDPIAFDDAVAQIRRFSLLERVGDSITIHRLVQAVTRDNLDAAASQNILLPLIARIDRRFAFDADDPRTMESGARLLPHALAATRYARDNGLSSAESSSLLNDVGLVLQARGDFEHARRVLIESLRITEEEFGANHALVAIRLTNLGTALLDTGDLEGAQASLERALRLKESTVGIPSSSMARTHNNLGSVLKQRGDLDGAQAQFELALEFSMTTSEINPNVLGGAMNNLASILTDRGELPAAAAKFQEVLELLRDNYGPRHPSIAICLNNIAGIHYRMGQFVDAQGLYEEALGIDEAVYGNDHPNVAIRLANLASVLRERGDLAGAYSICQRALVIAEAAHGPMHPDVAVKLNELGNILMDRNEFEQAVTTFERALAITENTLGSRHPTVGTRLNNLATAKLRVGDRESARQAVTRAVTILEDALGPQHPSTIAAQTNLASLDD